MVLSRAVPLGEQEQVGVHGQVPGVSGAGRCRGAGLRCRRAEKPVVAEGGVQGDDVLGVHQSGGAGVRDQLACPAGVPDGGGDDGEQAAWAQCSLAGRPRQAGIVVAATAAGGRAGRPTARCRAGADHGKVSGAGTAVLGRVGGAAAGAGRGGQEHLNSWPWRGDQVAEAPAVAEVKGSGRSCRPVVLRRLRLDGGQVCQRPPRGSPTSRASNARSAFGHQGQASARFGEVWCALEDLDLPTVPDLPSLLPAGGQAPGTVRILRLSRPALMPRRGASLRHTEAPQARVAWGCRRERETGGHPVPRRYS